MRNSIILVICIFVSFGLQAQLNPQSKKITKKFFPDSESLLPITPALKKKRGYTNYTELINFINELKESHPSVVSIQYIGESQKGYNIPVVHIKQATVQKKLKFGCKQVFMEMNLQAQKACCITCIQFLMTSPMISF